MLVDCTKATGPQGIYRLGPYGYDRNSVLCMIRLVRGNVEFQLYERSHLLDQPSFTLQQSQDTIHKSTLKLRHDNVVLMLSDMCLEWPVESDGMFVVQTFDLEGQQLSIERNDLVFDVIPFHATDSIRRVEEMNRRRVLSVMSA